MPKVLKLLVLAVTVAAVPVVASTRAIDVAGRGDALLLLALFALLAGARPVRLSSLRCELTATHPAVFCALAGLGAMSAVLTALAGVIGAVVARRGKTPALRLAYNVAAVSISVSAAAWVFYLLGGRPGGDLRVIIGPLTGATAAYFLANSALVASAIAVEKRQTLRESWSSSLSWTLPSYFTGLTLAVLLLLVLGALGPLGLVLGIPPTWLLVAFYRAHRDRIAEQERRIREVEALNAELGRTVAELRQATAHVKRLQGLLPICMHCRRIRDDRDAWHQIERYLVEHADVRFTHSVCQQCRQVHYPTAAGTRR